MDTNERDGRKPSGIGPGERERTEARLLEIARAAGLPEPDEVIYRDGEIELRWYEEKLAVVVDEIPMAGEGHAIAPDAPF